MLVSPSEGGVASVSISFSAESFFFRDGGRTSVAVSTSKKMWSLCLSVKEAWIPHLSVSVREAWPLCLSISIKKGQLFTFKIQKKHFLHKIASTIL